MGDRTSQRALSSRKTSFHIGINSPVRFEFFTAVTMKNAVFWDFTQCGSCKNRPFGGTHRHNLQGGIESVS
jgi:hypothetical protein